FVKITGNNCTSVNSDISTILVYAKPIAIVDDNSIIVCGGQTFTLGTPVVGNGITYSWTGPCGFTSNLQYPTIQNASACNAGTYTLVITNNGCLSDPATVMVTVKNKPPQPQIAGNGQVCEGATVTLVGSALGSSSYRWHKPGFDTTIYNINTLTLPNITVAGSATWQLTIESVGCLSDPSLPFTVQVQAYPDVTAASNSPLCSGPALQLMATGSIDSLAWCWTGPNGFVRYEKNPKVSPAVAGPYMVVGKTSFGCADSAFVDVVIVPAPVIDTVTNNAPVCASCNSNATLQALIQPIYGPLTYIWTGPGGFTSNLPSPIIPSICDDDNGSYFLTVQDTFGCLSQTKSTLVQVQKAPNTPNISPMSISVCQGEIVTFTVTNANDYTGNFVRYQWEHPVNGPTVTFTPSFTVGPVSSQDAGNYTVQVIVDSCISPVSANAQLTVKPTPPAPNATAADSILCEGQTLELFANPPTGSSYLWTKIPNDYTASIANPTIQNVDLGDNGQYFVRMTVGGCLSSISEPLQIVVNPRPPKPFLLPIQAICKDDPNAKLTLCVQDTISGAMYQFFNYDLNVALGPPSTSKCIQIADLSSLQPGLNNFYVVTKLGDCESLRSDLQSV
ncbi:MAG: hypothetical protein ABIQ93_07805, partial [Saprospiraceae bacterium]